MYYSVFLPVYTTCTLCVFVCVQACSQVELWGGSFGPKWNSLLRKWPLRLIVFRWTDNLRLKYLDILALFQG